MLLPEEYSSQTGCGRPRVRPPRCPDGAGLVVLDGTVTPELEAEGWAKDRIRELQELRKSTGLDVSDRISVVMAVPAAARGVGAHAQRPDRRARSWRPASSSASRPTAIEIGDGVRVTIAKA